MPTRRTSVRPAGVVAFLLTDIEGSTGMWQRQPALMRDTIRRHDAILAEHIRANGGRVLTEHGEGDSFFAVFPRATQALAAARDLQLALHAEPWPEATPVRVRMAINAGEAVGDFRGMAANRSARIRSLAVGGQVLVSQSAESLVRDELPGGVQLEYFGVHALRGVDSSERVYEARIEGVPAAGMPAAPAPGRQRLRGPYLLAAGGAAVVVLAIATVLWIRSRPAPVSAPPVASTHAAPSLAHLKIRTLVGTGEPGYDPSLVPADAKLDHPTGLVVAKDGSLYIADTGNDRVRVLQPNGQLVDAVGGGTVQEASGEDALQVKLNGPTGMTFDAQGNLYVADTGNNRVLRVDTDHHVFLVAGNGVAGDTGVHGLAADAELDHPTGVAIGGGCGTALVPAPCIVIGDRNGEWYVDTLDNTLHYGNIAVSGGLDLTTSSIAVVASEGAANRVEIDIGTHTGGGARPIAGTGVRGYSGDGGPALRAELDDPLGAAVDTFNRFFIADTGNNLIRVVPYSTGIITTVAGNGSQGYGGDGGPALQASLSQPEGVAVGANGDIYIADTGNNRIRVLTP